MSDFVSVARETEIPDPGKTLVEVDDRLGVVCRAGGEVYCLDDVCTHDGGPLGEGCLEGTSIACPRHGAKFDIRDGRPLTMPATKPTSSHEVKVADGQVWVRLNN